eukprot:scaffold234344_cov15-Tisochrysis_lutea.AAC.2
MQEAFITVVVIVVGSVLVFCLICVIIMGRSRQQSRMLENMLVISPDQLIIINHPVVSAWLHAQLLFSSEKLGG